MIYLNQSKSRWLIIHPNDKFFKSNTGNLERLAHDITNGKHYGYKIM